MKSSNLASDYHAYLEAYPEGDFATLARSRAQSLANRRVARLAPAAPVVPVATPVTPGMEKRILEYFDGNESHVNTNLRRLIEKNKGTAFSFNTFKIDCGLDILKTEVVEKLGENIVVKVTSRQPVGENNRHCRAERFIETYLFAWDGQAAKPLELIAE